MHENADKLYSYHGEPCHLFIISLKNSNLVNIAESAYDKKKLNKN